MALIETLESIGNAIREKNGTTEKIPLKEMADMILNISSGISCKSAIYNEDNSITLIDKNDVSHTIQCVYDEEGKLTGFVYDGEEIEIAYNDEGDLASVGGVEVDMSLAPENNTEAGYAMGVASNASIRLVKTAPIPIMSSSSDAATVSNIVREVNIDISQKVSHDDYRVDVSVSVGDPE